MKALQVLSQTVVASLAIAICVSCANVRDAKDQEQGQVKLPEFPNQSEVPLGLTSENGMTIYGASLLLWNESAEVDQIRAISDSSSALRKAKAGHLAMMAAEYQPIAQAVAEAETATKAAQMAWDQAPVTSSAYADALRPRFRTWFDTKLSEVVDAGLLSEADASEVAERFGYYCEYKVWELAVSQVLTNEFTSRPTPMQMCEDFYASREAPLFTDEALCGDAPNGRDYFECLWRDGVLKTDLFAAIADQDCNAETTRKAAIEGWLSSGLLRSALHDLAMPEFVDETYGDLLRGYIKKRGTVLSKVRNKHSFFSDCKKVFKMDVAQPDGASPFAYADSLNDIAFMVDTAEGSAPTWSLAPSTGNADTDSRLQAELAAPLRAFGIRSGGISVNDEFFNAGVDGQALADFSVNPDDKAFFDASPAFAAAREAAANAKPAEVVAALAEAKAHEAETKASLTPVAAAANELSTEVLDLTALGAQAVASPGAAQAFLPFKFTVTRQAELFELRVERPDVAMTYQACFEVGRGQRSCPDPVGQEFTLEFGADQGRIELTLPLVDPAGFGLKAFQAATSFSALPESAWAGRDLAMTLYYTRVGTELDLISGSAELRQGADVEASGSLSGDSYGFRLSQLR